MRRTTTLFVLVMLSKALWCQEPLVHKKTTYNSPDGKLYVNKALPIYLWLSTSKADNSEKHRLFSEECVKYSNPLYFDTEGYNTVRSPSEVDTTTFKPVLPQRDIIFEVYADSESPSTKIDFGQTTLHKKDGKLHLGTGTLLTLTAKDQLSGVENIYYSIDGANYTKYNGPINISQEKEYALKFYAVDNVGNAEKVHEYILVYDKTSPVTQLEVVGDKYENILSGGSKIILKSGDTGAGTHKIIYSLDQGEEKVYLNPLLAAFISQDDHLLKYYSIDIVGNKEKENTYAFYVDKTPPTIIEEVMGKSFFSGGKEFTSGKSRLKLTSFDNKAGVKEVRYSVNDGEYTHYDNPVFLTQTSGNLLIKSYAVDNVNNRSASQTANQKTSIPYIDLTGPGLGYSIDGPKFQTRDTLFICNSTKIILKGNDAEAGINHIDYSINGNDPVEFNKFFTINDAGHKVINFTGFDNVENTNTNTFELKVDNLGPEISYQFGTAELGKKDGLLIFPSHTVLFLMATDRVVGFQRMTYSINNGAAQQYTGMITGLPIGKDTVKVSAFDKLGNSTEMFFEFVIE